MHVKEKESKVSASVTSLGEFFECFGESFILAQAYVKIMHFYDLFGFFLSLYSTCMTSWML